MHSSFFAVLYLTLENNHCIIPSVAAGGALKLSGQNFPKEEYENEE